MLPAKMSVAGIVIVALVAVVTLLLGAAGTVNYISTRDRQWTKLQDQLAVDTEELATGLAIPVWHVDEAQIVKIMESAMQSPIIYAVVVNTEGNDFIRVRDAGWQTVAADQEKFPLGLLEKELPVTFHNRLIGLVKVLVTPRFIESEQREMLITTIAVIMALDLTLVFGLYLFLNLIVLKPLKTVEQYALAVSSGTLENVSIERHGFRGELENVRSSLEKMMTQLQARYDELQKSEDRFRILVEHATDAICVYDADLGVFVDANANTERLFGCSREEILRSGPQHFYLPNQPDGRPPMESIQENIRRTLDGEVMVFERAIRGPEGRSIISEVRLVKLPSLDRRIIRVSYLDITERKKAEEVLRKAKDEWERTFNSVPDLICLLDKDHRLMRVNRAMADRWGIKPDEAVGRRCYICLHQADVPPDNCPHTQMMVDCLENTLEVEIPELGGYFIISASPLFDDKGQVTGSVHVARDITSIKKAEQEKEKLERQLRQSQKMEAIGTLAGGIAHDFNNILAVIIGNTELAIRKGVSHLKKKNNLEQVLKASLRARDLVHQILAFSRRGENDLKPVELGPIIKEALKLLRSSLPSSIAIRQNIEDDPLTVKSDPTQIHQLLMNLCANAAHAMQDRGGILEVSLAAFQLEQTPSFPFETLPSGRYACLTVSDTGRGMDKATRERIFEPFFTTKSPGEGTGLGLAVVYGIVKSYGGEIKVYSEVGQGTIFRIYLPVVDSREVQPLEVEAKPLPGGTERILFVDDEEAIAQVGQEILQHLGYQVASLSSSLEALGVFKERPHDFDVVITDQTMPHMTGLDLSREILKIRPDISIILCTGFSQRVSSEIAAGIGIKRFLMKPLAIREVAEVVRAVLDEKGTEVLEAG